ncbi:multidrug resistance-associated 5 [Paramuricea clavata]|uniref:Multidrug resistance-associated 5 n=1 Tax=Paramuricea clavata TaxID=317549 RepID=A0A6S7IEJ5_PARCT|nr:multidrug resistance-associated 5 [Paramuricea clavata]
MLDKSLPKRTARAHLSDKPWMTPRIKHEIKAREKAFKFGDITRYKLLCDKVTSLVSNAKKNYYQLKAEGTRETNPAKWYKTIFELAATNDCNSQPPADDAADLAERLQQSFTKPWQNANPTEIPDVGEIEHLLKNDTSPPLPSIGQIKATLKHLNPRKATGSDEIPPWLLKRYHEELAPVIHNIICSSISQAKYPTLYKHALVTQVPKIYPPNDMDNDFRQISVLPQLAKVLESIQLKLNKGNLKIKDNQHAFTHGRSTVSVLASITQNWFNKTENSRDGRMGIHALFIDFCKAFDLEARQNERVEKLLAMDTELSRREESVVQLQGVLSSIRPFPSGVPQGSVVSPTLFNVHVDDLEDCIPNYLDINTHKYADDCTQDEVIPYGSASNMQEVLDAINDWAHGNKMKLNAKKTKDMWICFKAAIPEPSHLKIGDDTIERNNVGINFPFANRSSATNRSRSGGGRGGPPGRGGPAPEEFKTQLIKTLFDVNVTFNKGKLIGICGGVGSGKSSLINAILAQMNLVEGSVSVNGSMAYVAQQAWLMNASVMENIVFGQAFKPGRYEKVISACSLKQDLDIFPHGDQTEVGERGINLSGGQKQRISLARAVYADKDIYLLDDPLSAVDSHVGQHVFDNCIKGTLADKTIIFVTHQLQDFSVLINNYHQRLEAEENEDEDEEEDTSKLLEEIVRKRTLSTQSIGDNQPNATEEKKEMNDESKMNGVEKGKDNLMKAEDRKKGGVSFSTYIRYCKAAGGFCVAASVVLMLLTITLLRIFTDFWLGRWINDGNGNSTESDSSPGELNDNPDLDFYAAIFGSSLALLMFLLVVKCFIFVNTILRASSNLHNQVFRAVTKSPMEFFDTTPIGQILNRFSKDIDEMDTRLPFLVEFLILNLSLLLVIIILIAVLFYWFIIALVFFIALFIFLNIVFRRSVRELKRLDNITRSPIFSHISASVQGLSTLHAYGKTEEFVEKFEKLLDGNTLPFFMFACSHRWLAVRLDLITIGITTVTALLVILLRDNVPAAMGGLAITYAIRMSGFLQFTVRLTAETEAMFTSVERLLHYIDHLKQEGPSSIPDKKPADVWPAKGSLSMVGLKMRYREGLPLVLKGITCNIKAEEKIGIVGRTGSGKSSIGVSLFRLVEPADGTICIDGVNILDIGLDDLRSKLSIIPQDPILFIGTVRYNLDPFHAHADEDVWIALERAHLKDTISNLPLKLEAPVVENGENFSVGERQLMCMARALLRNCKVGISD